MAVDPIHQFAIHDIAQIGGTQIHLTNSAIYMAIAVGLTMLLLLGTTGSRRLVPTRMQSVAELTYELMANTLRNIAGDEGMKFFPFVFSLFMFILFANLVGLIPYAFTVTSHIIITAALALLVFFTVIIYGFWTHGLGWLKLFVPHGHPDVHDSVDRRDRAVVILFPPDLTQRPTVRQHAGRSHHAQARGRFHRHAWGVGLVGWLAAIAPLALTVALTALEFLVAALQAFVFAILTCIYLNDAIHPSHDPHPAH